MEVRSLSLLQILICYIIFYRYLNSMLVYSDQWALYHRAGVITRGHHTNNHCEAAMSVIKDIVLKRYIFFGIMFTDFL